MGNAFNNDFTCQLPKLYVFNALIIKPTSAPRTTTATLSGKYANFDLINRWIKQMHMAVGTEKRQCYQCLFAQGDLTSVQIFLSLQDCEKKRWYHYQNNKKTTLHILVCGESFDFRQHLM